MQKQFLVLQKLILPFLVLLIIAILFFNYFVSNGEFGDFATLDSDSNVVTEIIVKLVKEKGIKRTNEGSLFYVIDSKNREISVDGPAKLPMKMDSVISIKIIGHLTSSSNFHAHNIKLLN